MSLKIGFEKGYYVLKLATNKENNKYFSLKTITDSIKKWWVKLKTWFTFHKPSESPAETESRAEPANSAMSAPEDTPSGAYALKVERKLQECHEDQKRFIWQIIVKNSNDFAQRVLLEEKLPGDWKILNSSHPYQKDDAGTILFDVIAQPSTTNANTIVTYEVEVLE